MGRAPGDATSWRSVSEKSNSPRPRGGGDSYGERQMTIGRKILLVDDDAALRHSLAEQLRLHEEFAPAEAENGAKALELATQHISTSSSSMSASPTWTGASSAASCGARACARRSSC